MRRNEDKDFELPYPLESVQEYGWKPEQLAQQKEHLVHELATMQEALALGDITAVVDDVSLLLADFQINLDRKSASYRELGMQALRAYVRALQALEKRNAGEPIETPKFTVGALIPAEASGGSLRDAFAGWNKERTRPPGTVHEYMGHAWGSSAHGGYGGKTMLTRFGIERMQEAVAKVAYRGLDLSRVQPFVAAKRARIRN
jgi:hypothetical protein